MKTSNCFDNPKDPTVKTETQIHCRQSPFIVQKNSSLFVADLSSDVSRLAKHYVLIDRIKASSFDC